MFLDNFKKVIKILPNEHFQYVFYISDRKECNELKSGIMKPNANIVAFGECKTIDDKTAKALMPESKFIHNLVTSTMQDSYHCFCCEKLGVEQFVAHTTPIASWKCLINSLGNPEFCVITQEDIK